MNHVPDLKDSDKVKCFNGFRAYIFIDEGGVKTYVSDKRYADKGQVDADFIESVKTVWRDGHIIWQSRKSKTNEQIKINAKRAYRTAIINWEGREMLSKDQLDRIDKLADNYVKNHYKC